MVLTPDYLTTNQPEDCTQTDHTPQTPLRHLIFKSLSLKAIPEFGSYKH